MLTIVAWLHPKMLFLSVLQTGISGHKHLVKHLVSPAGWWCKNHLEKYEFVNGVWDDIPSVKWKTKHVWNHQAARKSSHPGISSHLLQLFGVHCAHTRSQPGPRTQRARSAGADWDGGGATTVPQRVLGKKRGKAIGKPWKSMEKTSEKWG